MSLTRSKKIDYPQLEQATVCLLNMPKAILYIFVLLIFLAPPVYGNGLEGCEEHVKYGAPSLEPVLLCRTGYALSHDVDHKVPDWVAYHLTRKKMKGTFPRSNDFRPDPDLEPGQRAELKDYKRSGYDRGHMAPAGAARSDIFDCSLFLAWSWIRPPSRYRLRVIVCMAGLLDCLISRHFQIIFSIHLIHALEHPK